ncbi:MAG: glycoside hydrolase family 2 TIM barrel-domain containing protein [Planctomycetota bacterium]
MRKTLHVLDHWKFSRGDAPEAAAAEFDDTAWDQVDVPHDWAFEAGPSADGDQGPEGGYYPGGIGWYRHAFETPDLEAEHQLMIRFEGVYMNSEVWLNGDHLGRCANGYRSFEYDITSELRPGMNVIAVRCDNTLEPSARWYHPCGIYAPVKLYAKNRFCLSHAFVNPVDVTAERAVLHVTSTQPANAQPYRVEHRLARADGQEVARAISTGEAVELIVDHPALWSPDTPDLYTLHSALSVDGKPTDHIETKVGIRSLRWRPDSGFWLNGKNLKIRGVCEHWEGGPVGGAWTPALLRWKLETLKAMGCNSIRTAHNPFPPFFYDLCDEMGILVVSEFFDGWKRKARYDYGEQAFDEHWESDLRETLRRDRHHPCIILWSVGNETEGDIADSLVRVCHEEDPTRMVTSGNAEPQAMDVVGLNGPSERRDYLEAERQFPDQPMVATEAPHTWQVRGYYRTQSWFRDGFPNDRQSPFPLPDLADREVFTYDWADPQSKSDPVKQVFNSSYDNAMVRITARQNWAFARDLAWHSGHYRWTGFDYPGEAGYVHGGWPFRAFMGGTHDLAGFPKDLAYFYQSQWTSAPMVHLLPHWTHPQTPLGTLIPVWAYANTDEVELFLNGQSLGVRAPQASALNMQCEWMVSWEPGELVAVAKNQGREVSRAVQATADSASRLQCAVDTRGDGLRIVTTSLVDDAGRLEPYADNRIFFKLSTPAQRIVHENGSPVDTEPSVGVNSRRAFMGLLRSFIQLQRQSPPSELTLGAILGSRNGVTQQTTDSATVWFDLAQHSLDGSSDGSRPTKFLTYYTVDGSTPTTRSRLYDQPFSVRFPATVRALVTAAGKPVFEMQETFGRDQGLYWPGDEATVHDDLFAGTDVERMTLHGQAHVANQKKGYHGQGYVELTQPGDGLSWCQENDGDEGDAVLRLRLCLLAGEGPSPRLELGCNGDAPQAINPLRPKTDQWQIVETTVRLKRGANEISLSAATRGTIFVDRIALA